MIVPLLVIVIIIVLAFVITGLVVGLLLHLLMAGLIGWLADRLIPGHVPYGFLGLVVVGLVGGWVGSLLLGRVGPSPFGMNLIPAFVGTLLVVAIVSLLARNRPASRNRPAMGWSALQDLVRRRP